MGSVEKVLSDDIHTTVHLTLKAEHLHFHLQRMAAMGVHAISLTSASLDLASEFEDLAIRRRSSTGSCMDMPVPTLKTAVSLN